MHHTDIEVVLTQTRDRRPLVTVRNLPGSDADLTPEQLRGLAAALLAAAAECERRPMDKRHFSRAVRRYDACLDMRA